MTWHRHISCRLVLAGRAVLLVASVLSVAFLSASVTQDTEAGPQPARAPLLTQSATPLTTQSTGPATQRRPAVLSTRVIGHSVSGHPIRAFELGDRSAAVTVVALAAMHGDETAGVVVLDRLRDGAAIRGVHLWVIPRDNPDGIRRHTRQNARGVDLNRNFPTRWKYQTGYYFSGPRPSSEPETRALQRFLDKVRPADVVTFHSPLYGVEVHGAKDLPFARRLSRDLRLPPKSFDCWSGCHGTLTQWFNTHHRGACVTVEFGDHPSRHYLRVRAPRGLLRAVGGRR